jgi:hypothetical protein
MGTVSQPPGKAMYVALKSDWDWLRSEQRKLYAQSDKQVDYVFGKLWGLVTDARNLRMALARVAGNRGRRTAGVDGVTVGKIAKRVDEFIVRVSTRAGEDQSADWSREDAAHICVLDAGTRKSHGLNPDVRLPTTALAVGRSFAKPS